MEQQGLVSILRPFTSAETATRGIVFHFQRCMGWGQDNLLVLLHCEPHQDQVLAQL